MIIKLDIHHLILTPTIPTPPMLGPKENELLSLWDMWIGYPKRKRCGQNETHYA